MTDLATATLGIVLTAIALGTLVFLMAMALFPVQIVNRNENGDDL